MLLGMSMPVRLPPPPPARLDLLRVNGRWTGGGEGVRLSRVFG